MPRDPAWRRRPAPGADARRRGWLVHRGLLTRRIEARCPDFAVRVVVQGRRRALIDERFVAGPPARKVLVREVLLNCGARPVVFAHSVARLRALRGPWRSLRSLGNRSLGTVLFSDPRVRRCQMRFRKLHRTHRLHERACEVLGRRLPPLWARRSLFVLRGAPLLVTEVFLPSLFGGSEKRQDVENPRS